ncbi:putative nucleolar GTP-binding protein 1 [Smittium mucronatum]|uniref:Nucleolar GTP-binding protein 1 n=1 Tax=Smittium mucronatum TaxID=133383 RepID=A0A1R0GQI8_9FUNG|nr:putative nucleolar GTP-binding protein 1 [Smittium mucronatum]
MSQTLYNFKRIHPVPSSSDFVDIVLSRTQRKTPTVVHPGYSIGRIRQFYMRKVKYTQETFEEKLGLIIQDFPQLDNVHPFYSDLMNVLYDKDHYKLALGQINTAKHLITSTGKDLVRLLKFADSLYRCKMLKKAALGRMATIMKRQKDSLGYLEQVRMHLSRLPSIDTNTRTLLICGYPNVGKSSFMNKVTRADVDVQPYAFTTKSLFVGHMDYKYLRWQVIDTPGILDHELEERNTIEMQAITALAHLRACVLFFIDLSEQCGYSIEVQLSLFNSIKPLFGNRPTFLVMSKTDACQLEDLPEEMQAKIRHIEEVGDAKLTRLSSYMDTGVMETRNMACESLLQFRVDSKLKGSKIKDTLNRINLSVPAKRDSVERPAFIPPKALSKVKYDKEDPERPMLLRDVELMNGGAGVYSINLKKDYLLKNDEWKEDVIPEIIDGKNISDFIDPEIEHKLAMLEKEEEQFQAEGVYDHENGSEEVDEDEARIIKMAKSIRARKQVLAQESRLRNTTNRPKITTKMRASKHTVEDFEKRFKNVEISGNVSERAAGLLANSKRKRPTSIMNRDDKEEKAMEGNNSNTLFEQRSVSVVRDRSMTGLQNDSMYNVASKKKAKFQRKSNLLAKRGEADRQILTKMPKHLFSGKRKNGTNDYR